MLAPSSISRSNSQDKRIFADLENGPKTLPSHHSSRAHSPLNEQTLSNDWPLPLADQLEEAAPQTQNQAVAIVVHNGQGVAGSTQKRLHNASITFIAIGILLHLVSLSQDISNSPFKVTFLTDHRNNISKAGFISWSAAAILRVFMF
jgi:hypothetical protein